MQQVQLISPQSMNKYDHSWLQSEDGMLPVNSLPSKDNSVSIVKFESEAGILPVNVLLENDNEVSRIKFESDEGMLPVN